MLSKYALLHDEYATRLLERRKTDLDNDREWLFSFINICDALTIDPQYLRKGLLRWKRNVFQLSAEGPGQTLCMKARLSDRQDSTVQALITT